MSLIVEVQPSAEPVTVQEVKDELRLSGTIDDAMISRKITAAREFAEKITRRSLVYKGYVNYLDRFPSPGQPIRVPAPPLISVTSVLYLDTALNTQTWDSAEYFVASKQSPGLIVPKAGLRLPGSGLRPRLRGGPLRGGVFLGWIRGSYGPDPGALTVSDYPARRALV
jgi:uncharacterized phiE125 gp8 family phage protein